MAQRYGKFIAAWNPYITYPKTFCVAFGTWLLACRSITTLCSVEFIITSPVVKVVSATAGQAGFRGLICCSGWISLQKMLSEVKVLYYN